MQLDHGSPKRSWGLADAVGPELSGLAKGDLLTVSVAVPANSNALSSSWFYRGQTFDESVSILVEQ